MGSSRRKFPPSIENYGIVMESSTRADLGGNGGKEMKRLIHSVGSFFGRCVLASLLAAAVMVVIGTQTASAQSNSPIVIGYVGDSTGLGSPTFGGGAQAAQARVDLQNAQGGVNGHKLVLKTLDDSSSPTNVLTSIEDLNTSQHVFGIIEGSVFFFSADRYTQENNIPVTGFGVDGTEWGQQPYTNLFDIFPPYGIKASDGSETFYTTTGNFLKDVGVTKFASVGYGGIPSSVQGVEAYDYTFEKVGLKQCYQNVSIPFGSVDFTAVGLQIKSSGCNGIFGSMEEAGNVALAQEVKNAGIPVMAQLNEAGYDNGVLRNSLARSAADGNYFNSYINFSSPNAPTSAMLAALKKYDPSWTGGVPSLGVYSAYFGTDLMIYGLKHAGTNPTRSSFISNLRKVDNYTGGGVFSSPTTFQHFGTQQMDPVTQCQWYVKMKGSNFVVYNNGKPVCGKRVAVPASVLK